jgi:hypothetical protein
MLPPGFAMKRDGATGLGEGVADGLGDAEGVADGVGVVDGRTVGVGVGAGVEVGVLVGLLDGAPPPASIGATGVPLLLPQPAHSPAKTIAITG